LEGTVAGNTVSMSSDQHVRIGLVGAGGVGERHARVLSGLAGVSVVGVADPEPARAETLAGRCDAEAFAAAEPLVAATRPDALYVCVPPFAHGEPEMVAVEHGLPLFVEKPLAADMATAERLGAAIAAAGLTTATGYHWRWLDTVQRTRDLLAGSSPPALVAARWLDKVPPPAWWTTMAGSGGQVVEQVTHLIDLIRYLVGEVRSVTAHRTRPGQCGVGGDIDENCAAILQLADGAVGTLSATCLAPHKQSAVLDIAAPGLGVALSEEQLVVHDGDGAHRTQPTIDARTAVDQGFVDLVRGRPSPHTVSYAEAIHTHRVACAITTSAREGRTVDLSA
jgi:myo-inositol 2-dehydrogenase / D-chiro-inositol 1-dehydrogenase